MVTNEPVTLSDSNSTQVLVLSLLSCVQVLLKSQTPPCQALFKFCSSSGTPCQVAFKLPESTVTGAELEHNLLGRGLGLEHNLTGREYQHLNIA